MILPSKINYDTSIVVDNDTLSLPLSDVPNGLIPVMIGMDGNCFPRCLSQALWGEEGFHVEIRMWIIPELVAHEDLLPQ